MTSTETARSILDMREQHRVHITERLSKSANALKLLDYLFQRPMVSASEAKQVMEVSFVTASNVIGKLEETGLLKEITGQKRNKVYRYEPYIALFNQRALALPRDADEADTGIGNGLSNVSQPK
jgi:ribosomal protein S25